MMLLISIYPYGYASHPGSGQLPVNPSDVSLTRAVKKALAQLRSAITARRSRPMDGGHMK